MKYVHEQLDCFGPGDLVLGRYQLLGRDERRTGGVLHLQLLQILPATVSPTSQVVMCLDAYSTLLCV